MKLSLIIEAIDRATGPAKRSTAAIRQLTDRGLKPLEEATKRVDRTAARFLGGMPARLASIHAGVRRLAGQAGMKALEKSSYAAGYAVGATLRKVSQLALRVGAFGAMAIGAGGIGALGFLTRGVLGRASDFEQYTLILENQLGSLAKAKAAMKWVEDFAVRTPYELGEVMSAFTQMTVLDFKPMTGTLEALGNAAAALGTDLSDAVNALASATAGEFEPLRRYGIRIAKDGATLRLEWRKNGKVFRETVRDDQAALERAISGIMNKRFPEMMKRQSNTFLGMWRNLSDQFGKFQGMIADAGFFDAVRKKLQSVLEWVDQLAKNGKLKEWAEAISNRMTEMTNKAYEFVTKVKWDNVAKGIEAIVSGLINVVDWIGRASDAYGRWEIKAARTRELGSYDKVWNRMFGGTYERYQQRERIRDLNRAMGLPENKGLEGEPDDKPRILPQTKGWIGSQQRSLQQYLDRRAPGAAGPAPTGKISLHVTTDRGVTAQPRKVEARGMQIELNTGRAMAGLA